MLIAYANCLSSLVERNVAFLQAGHSGNGPVWMTESPSPQFLTEKEEDRGYERDREQETRRHPRNSSLKRYRVTLWVLCRGVPNAQAM